jgi:hypothetical protein
MKTLQSLLAWLGLAVCLCTTGLPQGFTVFLKGAEATIKSKHPYLEMVEKTELSGKEVVYRWRSAEQYMRLLVFYGVSREEAAKKMSLAIDRLSMGPGRKLTGLGDEAYLATSHNTQEGHIRFRKSNVYVELTAPTVGMAEDLAKNLASLIARK